MFTPRLNEKIDSGKTHLQDLAQWWRTSQGVDIPKISQFYWGLFEKTRFLCFYIIKSMARKGYFGPKSDFKGSKIPPRGASSTWNMYYYMWDTCTSHFGPKKFDRVGRRGQGRSKYGTFGSFQWEMCKNAMQCAILTFPDPPYACLKVIWLFFRILSTSRFTMSENIISRAFQWDCDDFLQVKTQ